MGYDKYMKVYYKYMKGYDKYMKGYDKYMKRYDKYMKGYDKYIKDYLEKIFTAMRYDIYAYLNEDTAIVPTVSMASGVN